MQQGLVINNSKPTHRKTVTLYVTAKRTKSATQSSRYVIKLHN